MINCGRDKTEEPLLSWKLTLEDSLEGNRKEEQNRTFFFFLKIRDTEEFQQERQINREIIFGEIYRHFPELTGMGSLVEKAYKVKKQKRK